MMTPGPNYWPFAIDVPVERRTPQQQATVEFLETAYRENFEPCLHLLGGSEYHARNAGGRDAWLIARGGVRNGEATRWEVRLSDAQGPSANYWVDRFADAADTVLQWLRGISLTELLESAKPSMIRGPMLLPQQSLAPA